MIAPRKVGSRVGLYVGRDRVRSGPGHLTIHSLAPRNPARSSSAAFAAHAAGHTANAAAKPRRAKAPSAAVSGPLVAGGPAWPVRGIDAGTVELETPGPWIAQTQLAQLVRNRAGKVEALEVSTGRIKKMRFARVD